MMTWFRAAAAAAAAAVALALLAAPARAQDGPDGVYRGVYVCNQGLTGATLRFCQHGERIEIGFRFYEVPDNPGVPTGTCYLAGDYSPESRSFYATATAWGVRPGPEWIIAPFGGLFTSDYQTFRGLVDSEGCSFIILDRVEDEDGVDAPMCGPAIG